MILSVLPAKLYCGKRFKSGFIPFLMLQSARDESWTLKKWVSAIEKKYFWSIWSIKRKTKYLRNKTEIFFRVKNVGINAQNIPKKQLFSLSLTSNSKFLHQKKTIWRPFWENLSAKNWIWHLWQKSWKNGRVVQASTETQALEDNNSGNVTNSAQQKRDIGETRTVHQKTALYNLRIFVT